MKNNIIKASEEVFPIDKEMSLDEQCDQFLRQIGFKFGANWAIERACEFIRGKMHDDEDYGIWVQMKYKRVEEFINDFKKTIEGDEE